MKKNTIHLVVVLLASVVLLGTAVSLGAQDSTEDIMFDFTFYEGNPVLARGEEGAWDAGFTFMGNVLYEEGVFHMFYIGGEGDFNESNLALGYASSEDGLHWTKYAGNPLLPLDGNARLESVFSAVPIHDADMWVLYITPHIGRAHPASVIFRATAPEPTGPWEVSDTPVLEGGGDLSGIPLSHQTLSCPQQTAMPCTIGHFTVHR